MQNSFLRGVTTLFVAGSAALLTFAANITGTIRDKQGETLPQASVRLLSERDSSFVSGTAAETWQLHSGGHLHGLWCRESESQG